jgi:hypothetical protein
MGSHAVWRGPRRTDLLERVAPDPSRRICAAIQIEPAASLRSPPCFTASRPVRRHQDSATRDFTARDGPRDKQCAVTTGSPQVYEHRAAAYMRRLPRTKAGHSPTIAYVDL